MDLHLAGKRALVTGGSKGIGFASALALAEEGCNLVLVSRTADDLARAAERVRSRFDVSAESISADLSLAAEVERVSRQAGAIDILVNNAGAIPPGDLLSLDEERWRSAWDLKVFGYIALTKALYSRLRASRGVVVNIIGSAGERFDANYIAGSTGNAALMAFTRALGTTSPRDGVRVVGINPGPVATDRIEMLLRARALRETGDADRWRDSFKNMAFGRPAEPAEIAAAVAFLASSRSSYTSGTILTIDDPARAPL